MARENSPKPSRVATPCRSLSRCAPLSLSKLARACSEGLSGRSWAQPSGTTTSLGPRRASSALSSSGPHSASTITPVEMSTEAIPKLPRTSASAANLLARRGSSRASSVRVPAVTKRTMSRLTRALEDGLPSRLARALASSGVSTCSAIATRSPAFMRRAR